MTEEKKTRRRRPSSLPSVISITLVLFLFGLLALLLFNAKKVSDQLRENIEIEVYFAEEVSEENALRVKLETDKLPYVKKVRFISKEEATKQFMAELGQDFMSTLGASPLPHSMVVNLKSSFTADATVKQIAETFERNPQVAEVNYPRNVLEQMNRNLRLIGSFLLVLSLVLLLVAVGLINGTIRLNMYARRFLIKSMQLVGATEWFIIRPYIGKFALIGVISGVLATGLLGLGLWYFFSIFPDFRVLFDLKQYILLLGILILAGVFIVAISTWFSTRRYLRMKIDQLY